MSAPAPAVTEPTGVSEARRGAVYAALAYACWGLFPLYFRTVSVVPPLELLLQRIAWSLLFVMGILLVRRHLAWLWPVLRSPRTLALFAMSAATLAANWFIFIWAVNHGFVIESSLGYFINPLVNVVVGAAVLRERLRPWQWAAVALAATGVLWLTWVAGRPPWIALALALTFCAYGLQRKLAPLGALEGLALESMLLAPLALIGLVWMSQHQMTVFADLPGSMQALVAASGPVTAIPLLLFAWGARRIPFSLLGLLQYIGPTLQLLIGVFVMGEAFEGPKVWGFVLIWAALALYSAETFWVSKQAPKAAP